MDLASKHVFVELRTVIDDNGRKELSIIKQTGIYKGNKNIEMISFIEQTEDFGEIKNVITILPKKVTIKRTGLIRMSQQFIAGRRSECLYRHPYGSFLMEIDTKSIVHLVMNHDNQGSVIIEYDARMNDDEIRHHHLTLTYMEENLK